MHRRAPLLIRTAAAMLLAIAWIDGVGVELHARAMACCAHRHDCGGNLRAPDQCCERMGHSAPPKTGTVVQSTSHIGIASTGVTPAAPFVQGAPLPDRPGIARLHDPPHLHPFALLI